MQFFVGVDYLLYGSIPIVKVEEKLGKYILGNMSFDGKFDLIDSFVQNQFHNHVEEHLSEVLELPTPIEPYILTKLARHFIIALKNEKLSPTEINVLLKNNYIMGSVGNYKISSKGHALLQKTKHLEFESERFCKDCGSPLLVSTHKNYCDLCVSAVAREPWHKR